MMKKRLLTLSAAFVALLGFSQSDPTPFDLGTGAYTFTEWASTSSPGTYPDNMIFHDYTTEPGLAAEPSGDWVCTYDISTRARINGLGADGVAFLNTGDRQDSQSRCGNGPSDEGYFIGDATVALNTTGRTNITVAFDATLLTVGGGATPREYGLRLQYRIGTAGAWNDLPTVVEFSSQGRVAGESESYSVTLPNDVDNQPIVQVRWKYYQIVVPGGGGTRPQIALDEITINSDVIVTPTIVSSVSSLNPFTQILGTPSAEQSFSIEGENLTEDITLTASAEYEVSLTTGSGFASSVVVPHTSGTVAATTVYVRLNAAAVGTHAGTVTATSQDATDVVITLNGQTVEPASPIVTASVTTLSGFDQILGAPSAEQSFTVEGENLTEDITLTASAEYEVSLTTGTGFASSVAVPHTSGTVAATTIYVRLNAAAVGTHAGTVTAASQDAADVVINLDGETTEPATPEIQTSVSSLSGFNQVLGTPSAEQSFTVEGEYLESDITLTASAGYEISLTTGSGFASSVVVPHASGTVTATTVYVRLNETTVGTHSGTVTASSQNAGDAAVDLDGETTEPVEPTDEELLYYWHFNNMPSGPDVTEIIADFSFIPTIDGKFTYTDPIAGERDIDRYSEGSSFNLQQGEGEGYSARVRNPSTTRSLVFDVPTTGAEGIGFRYAVQRSGQGMLHNIIEYSVDGINFISTDLENNTLEVVGAEVWQLFTFDLSSITAVNDNPNFKIKITWDGNTTASNGNNRYDNITLTAESVGSDVSVSSISGKSNLKLYPIPFEETISISSPSNIKEIQVVDLLGKVVKSVAGSNGKTQQISTGDLIPGTYIFMVQTTEGVHQLKSVKK